MGKGTYPTMSLVLLLCGAFQIYIQFIENFFSGLSQGGPFILESKRFLNRSKCA